MQNIFEAVRTVLLFLSRHSIFLAEGGFGAGGGMGGRSRCRDTVYEEVSATPAVDSGSS